MAETWKAIPGFEGLYEVSDLGRVRSLDRITTHPHPKSGTPVTRLVPGRVLRPKWAGRGYQSVCLSWGEQRVYRYVHALVLQAFVGPRPDGHETRHLDGVRTHNWLTNLEWATPVVNQADRNVHGTDQLGEHNAMAKLTTADVLAIRAGAPGERFGVTEGHAQSIVRRDCWKHV